MYVIKNVLSQNRYSRIGKKIGPIKGIVVHCSNNEGYSATALRNYYENLKNGKNALYRSSHYIVGLGGEILQLIPEDEISYHIGKTDESDGFISIECCIESAEGAMPALTRISLKGLIMDICQRYEMDVSEQVLRHFDIDGSSCPRFYVSNNEKWKELKADIVKTMKLMDKLKLTATEISNAASKQTGYDRSYIKMVLTGQIPAEVGFINDLLELICSGCIKSCG